jgi:hypothetical protein
MSDIAEAREADRQYRLLKPFFLTPVTTLDRGRGTAFPTAGLDGGALVAGERFFRTDLGLACYYAGAAWLTVEQFQCDVTPYSRNPLPFAGAGATTVLIVPQRTDYASYYVRAKAYLDVLTTNNATNYWQCSLYLGGTNVWTFNTSADAAGTGLNKEDSTAAVTAGAAFSKLDVIKSGAGAAPGSLFVTVSYWYRLIIT